jgi:Protein of unknown function (DUF3617)
MVKLRVFIFAIAMSAAVSYAAEPLNAKLGLWEINYTTETSGMMIPKATLDKMPPEQRAKMEAMMKQRAAASPKTRPHKSCMTKADLQKGSFGDEDDKNCTYKWSAETHTKREGTFQCAGDSRRTGSVNFEVPGGDKVRGEVRVAGENGKFSMQMSGRWIGTDCKGADD